MASEQPATLSSVPEATKQTYPPRKLWRKRETQSREGREGDQFLTGHRKRERKTPGKEANIAFPAPHLPQRTGDHGGQMESWQPGGWEGEDA